MELSLIISKQKIIVVELVVEKWGFERFHEQDKYA